MAITVEARTNIIGLVVGMFNAAPGASVLADLVASYEAGTSIKAMAGFLAATNEFKGIFPTFLTNGEYATKVVNQLLAEASTAAKAEAVAVLTAELNGGMSRSDAFVEAITFVNATATDNATFGTSAAAFDNKVAVAVYYSVDKQLSGATLEDLQKVVVDVTSAASTVTAAKAIADGEQTAGKAFTLTTFTDTITGTIGDDTITGGALASDGTTAADTLQALDVINGGAGTDTLVLDTTGDKNQSVVGTVTNVENLTFVGSGTTIAAVTASTFSGDIKFQQTADATLSVTGVTGQKLILDRAVDGTTLTSTHSGTSASFQAAAVAGDATFSLSGGTVKTANLAIDKTATGKSVTVTDTGNSTTAAAITASGASTVTVTSTALTSVTVAGAGKVSLTTTTAPTTSVDASAATGGFTLVTALAAGATFTGGAGVDTLTVGTSTKAITTGAGNDVVTMGAALGSGGSIDGGEGSDTISLSAADAATATSTALLGAAFAASISNFEKLGVGATGAATVVDAKYIDGITHIVSAGTVGANTLTVNNAAANSTLEFTALAAAAVTYNLADATGTTDVVNLKFSATDGFTSTAAVVIAGVETLNIVTDDTNSTAATAPFVAPITATSVKSVVVTGDAGIDTTGLTATTLTSFDASGVTATGAGGAVTLVTGALAGDAVIKGGAGNDVLNAAASVKLVTIDGGAGNDTITGSSTKVNTLNGGAGDDTIVGGSAADTINGGDGNDTITSGAGLDIVDVGAGNDTYVVTANANGNVYASITGMGAGDKIDFLAGGGAAAFTATAITLAGTAAFADFLQAAAAGGADRVVWFQYGGDTYVVQDVTAGATFTNGADQVVKLVGLVNLATATIDGAASNVLTLA
tara:strand:+ start:1007 stop:3619 length:2613 start_codon:yes stop_codon:yes gene_type:complete